MRVLVINPILYTSENRNVPKVKSIKDTMIYDLCLAFCETGNEVELYAADLYRPIKEEDYPFAIQWGKCCLTGVFLPNRLPWMPDLWAYLKNNQFDLIISSEVFSLSTYIAYRQCGSKVIAWHEIAKHQAMFHQIPSKLWYGIIAKHVMKNLHVVCRSEEAKRFIKQYCDNVEDCVIDHGVNLKKFKAASEKKKQFIVCSQLIPRKKIDGIIDSFRQFVDQGYSGFLLYIVGDGECSQSLKNQVASLGLDDKVIFTGKLSHDKLHPILAESVALLVNTEKDNNMISIVESIAAGTPVVTTEVPLNASYIKSEKLGIAKNGWGAQELEEIVDGNKGFVDNCLDYRIKLSTTYKANQFIKIQEGV